MNRRLRNKVIEHYLPCVEKIIQDYKNCALEYSELFSIGNYALVEIAGKYDKIGCDNLDKTIEFYIRKSIIKEMLENLITINIPENEFHKIITYLDSIKLYSIVENGQINLYEICNNENPEYSDLILLLFFPLISLDEICSGDRITYEKILINFKGRCFLETEKLAKETLLKKHVDEMLQTLTSKEERVIRLRFGIDDCFKRTLGEVGIIFKKSRERIRQIEVTALKKLRLQIRKNILMMLLEKTYIEKIHCYFNHSEK